MTGAVYWQAFHSLCASAAGNQQHVLFNSGVCTAEVQPFYQGRLRPRFDVSEAFHWRAGH